MTKKNTRASGDGARERIDEFRGRVEGLVGRGYTCLGSCMPDAASIELPSRSDMRTAMAGASSEFPKGRDPHRALAQFDCKQSNPVAVTNAGTPGLGYIPWGGSSNDLPNMVYDLVAKLPYTSAAVKYLIDLSVGRGPKLMYKWAKYTGGTVSEELVPFEHAGVLISNRLRELQAKLEEKNGEGGPDKEGDDGSSSHREGLTISWNEAVPRVSEECEEKQPEPGSLEYEIEQLKSDYQSWKESWEEISEFIENNNLGLHFLKCMTDYTHMDMYIPTVGFEIGRAGEWDPKIKVVGHIPDVCGRLEQMDANLRVNYVYYSERWRQDTTAELQAKEIVAYPSVMNETMLNGWKSIIQKNRRTRVKDRPTWVACPIRYPSMQNPYYPRPAWWSIFTSMVYNYASTLVVDKAIARENATMWSKIIFINQEYLQAIFDLEGADTPDKQREIRNSIYNRVNNLLKSKENHGKTLLMDMFPASDGKTMQYSIEIVDVPQPSSGAETKDELEEISSIIFFAFGVHPALIGAVPGKSGSSGGTYQRELTLIKQNLIDPSRSLYLKFLQNIHSFNKWDKHGVWKISDLVLTTLDRSKTGTEEVMN